MTLRREAAYILKDDLGSGGGVYQPTATTATTDTNYPKQIHDQINAFMGRVSQLKKGLLINSLYATVINKNYNFNPKYAYELQKYVATYFLPGLISLVHGKLSGLPSATNLGALMAVNHIKVINKIIIDLHVARRYYCFKAEKTTGLEQAKNQIKKQIVTEFANWIASGYNNAVKKAGGSTILQPAEYEASKVLRGVEVYDWEGETITAKFNAFAADVSTSQKPYEVNIGTTTEIPPVIVTTTDYTKGDSNQSGAGSNNADNANAGSGSGSGSGSSSNGNGTSEVPDGSQSLVNNLTDDAKAIADGKKPSRWWWWLVAAGVGGYILNSGSKTTVTTGARKKDDKPSGK